MRQKKNSPGSLNVHHHTLRRRAGFQPALRLRIAATLALLLTATVRALAAGENVTGAWDPTVYSWPLIPVHAVLMPDSRIMTYGTDNTGKQTGYFIYDVWDINSG